MKIELTLLISFILSFWSCNSIEEKNKALNSVDRFINPPLENANVPFSEFKLNAEIGDTIIHSSGTILTFPPNSFLDSKGNIVKGEVQIKYREFCTPLDFYLSGIPMNYDSLDQHYNFESSGMCQIEAYKSNIPLFVNPMSKPEVNLISSNTRDSFNLYYLDTIQKKWINKGKSIVKTITKNKRKIYRKPDSITLNLKDIVEPIMPSKTKPNIPVLKIEVDPKSVQELIGYNNLQFQLVDNIENYDTSESAEEWDDMQLEKSETKGIYIVKFSNKKRKVIHKVKPVIDSKEYDQALELFEKKQIEYEKLKTSRLEEERIKKAEYDSIINDANSLNIKDRIVRVFSLDAFGIINCDRLTMNNINNNNFVATFTDKIGTIIKINDIVVLYETFKGLNRFPNSNIRLTKSDRNFICGTMNKSFVYLSFKEFDSLNLDFDKKEQTFAMNIVPENKCTYAYISGLAHK